ncbi:restriction endonuclease subunit S [Brachyspira pilosicoli]|uniref:restriction endonuclease subunit S n=1 Tax=Brachyspira pilosicoli TaxID=52584 RepID=UPI0012F647E7|nr:restriction endonuclease subunit S [Brachyspira pilosicoli]
MSNFEDLIKKHCPDGVEYKTLEDVCIIYTGEQLNRKNMIKEGYPVINGGIQASGYTNNFNEYEETITISQGGASAGFVNFMLEKFWAGAHCYIIKPNTDKLINKYLFFVLKNIEIHIMELKNGAGIPGINKNKITKIKIPLPPIEVQKEIVGILDTFTKYQDLLNRELELRKKQYEYYRNYLFNKIQSYNNVLLGDIADISVGSKPEFISDNKTEFEYINAGTTNSGYTNNYNCLGDTVTTPSRGQGGIGYIGYQKNNFWLGALCYQIRSNKDYILTKYIYYYLKNNNELILKIKNSGGLPSVNRNDLIKINIKFPSLEYQKEIIDILDQFDTLCNDITRGLPAEIELRKKQYEYYRDKLVTFKEKKK